MEIPWTAKAPAGGALRGKIRYDGLCHGTVYVGLFLDLRDVCPVFSACLPGPGRYSIEGVYPGRYYVLAGLDADPFPKSHPDNIVAMGSYRREMPVVIREGETLRGIDIHLLEA